MEPIDDGRKGVLDRTPNSVGEEDERGVVERRRSAQAGSGIPVLGAAEGALEGAWCAEGIEWVGGQILAGNYVVVWAIMLYGARCKERGEKEKG